MMNLDARRRLLVVPPEAVGQRLDLFLSEAGIWPSRSLVQKIIADGGVRLNEKRIKASYRLALGDHIEVNWREAQPMVAVAEAIPLDVLYEDSDLIVVNKPRGMVVHPAAGNFRGTLVNALLHHCRDLSGIGGVIRPGIVHRLDKDTSGVLVAAKNDQAHLALASQLKLRRMKRVYLALVHGNPPVSGRIDAPIARHPRERKKMAVVAGGKPAITHFQVLTAYRGFAFLKVVLETGRTHQIRVHLSRQGYPLLGDTLYGWKKDPAPIEGQALHAAVLGFTHPKRDQYLEFETPLPPEMERLMQWCADQAH